MKKGRCMIRVQCRELCVCRIAVNRVSDRLGGWPSGSGSVAGRSLGGSGAGLCVWSCACGISDRCAPRALLVEPQTGPHR